MKLFKRRAKLCRIIGHYGIYAQLKHFHSEVFELVDVILSNYCLKEDQEIDVNHITEELADCFVMLEQFLLYYNISSQDLKKVMDLKINRQIKRIETDVK